VQILLVGCIFGTQTTDSYNYSTSLGDPAFFKQKAPEIFARALSNALELPELKVSSPHSQARMAVFQKWSAAVKDNSTFADRLLSLMVNHAFSPAMLKALSLTTKYEKMWTGYHQLMIGDELSSLRHGTFKHVSVFPAIYAASD